MVILIVPARHIYSETLRGADGVIEPAFARLQPEYGQIRAPIA